LARKRANNEGSLFKLPSSHWCAQISLGGKRISKTFHTQKEGQEWIRKMRGLVDDGLTYSNTRLTVNEFMDSWITTIKTIRRKSTWTHYESLTRRYIKPALGNNKLLNLRAEQVQFFYNDLQESGVSIHTIDKIHTAFHAALEHAMRLGMINRNPAHFVRPPKIPPKEMAILTDSQVCAFLVTLQGHRWEALFHLAIVTGARQMELLGLKWTDVDWVRKVLKIERQLERPDGNGVQFSPPKTKNGRRTINLGKRSMEILRIHHEKQQQLRKEAGEIWSEHGLIFTTNNGTPIHPRNLLRDFRILLKDAGLPQIRFHDLRHTAATLMLNNSVPVIVVSRRLGHAKASITLDVYGHLIPSMQAEAAELMDELVMPVAVQLNQNEIHR